MQLVIMDSDGTSFNRSGAPNTAPEPTTLATPDKNKRKNFLSTHRQDNLFNPITHQFLVSMSTKNPALAVSV